ncbi:MAG: hypothetical protein ACFFE8_02710 [Candidatus Heimdallarchaeota archaeon]
MNKSLIYILFFLLIYTPVSIVSINELDNVKTDKITSIEPVWNQTFGGLDDDGIASGAISVRAAASYGLFLPPIMIQTVDGGYLITGLTESYGAGFDDIWVIKTDPNGNPEWNQTFGGIQDDRPISVIQSNDGGYVVAGTTQSFGGGGFDAWLLKTDVNGQHEWNRTFGGPANDWANSVVQTTDGGYLFAGGTISYGAGASDMWLVKTNASGTAEWNKTLGKTGVETANSIIQTSDGGFVIAGQSAPFSSLVDTFDFWMVKINASGETEWENFFGGEGFDVAITAIQTLDGGFGLVGTRSSLGTGSSDGWLVKTNTNGHHEWNSTIGGTEPDSAETGIQTSDGGFVLVGRTSSYGAGAQDVWIVKINSNGQHLWNSTIGGSGTDAGGSVVQTSDGGFIISGTTESYGAGGADFWLVKVKEVEVTTTATTTSQPTRFPGFLILLSLGMLDFIRKLRKK